MYEVFLLSNTAAGDGFQGALGICLVSNEAFVVGSAAIPGPLTDSDWDGWIWHDFFHVFSPAATLAAGAGDGAASVRGVIDSKAMRKWSEGYTLAAKVETVENGTATGEFWADTRVLVKLA